MALFTRFAILRICNFDICLRGVLIDCSLELKELHDRFTTEVQGKRTVPLKLLRNILEQCNSTEDVDLAFRIMKDYRVYVSSQT